MLGLERHCIATASTASRARPATRCGGRARANARLARWATFLGSQWSGKRPATTFFVFRWCKHAEKVRLQQLTVEGGAPRVVHAVNLRQRVSVCTALHFLLQKRMPHRAQL